MDYEDAKDLPIELRRLEDFEDFPEPPLSAGLKSRSLGSILNPPPRQIVRSRSSVPSLGAQISEKRVSVAGAYIPQLIPTSSSSVETRYNNFGVGCSSGGTGGRPKLVKQKQSLCDDDLVIPEQGMFSTGSNSSSSVNCVVDEKDTTRLFLRKQSSLNEELMAENRIRDKERVKKRIHKQMSLNEAYLCRSIFSRRLQVIREGFTTKLKISTGSLERVTKCSLVKIMQNFKSSSEQMVSDMNKATNNSKNNSPSAETMNNIPNGHLPTSSSTSVNVVTAADSAAATMLQSSIVTQCSNNNNGNLTDSTSEDPKVRRHSRESGSDSSKDSLQSDTSIESEDSFASVIYIPRPDQCNNSNKTPSSVPTSPLVMPCPTPAQSPAPTRYKIQPQQFHLTAAATPVLEPLSRFTFEEDKIQVSASTTINQQKIAPKFERITKQIVKNLPQIPKFRKPSTFALVHRHAATGVPIFAKLAPMDIFNPETDDLDSDSSEPSSPDSIDSVISALNPLPIKAISNDDDDMKGDSAINDRCPIIISDQESLLKPKQHPITVENDDDPLASRRKLVDFAERLSAQLLKEFEIDDTNNDEDDNDSSEALINDKNTDATISDAAPINSSDIIVNHNNNNSNNNEKELPFNGDGGDPYVKRLNVEIRDLNSLREELRERRLMLANLNIHQFQNSSTSSTIHEEDESPRNEENDGDEDADDDDDNNGGETVQQPFRLLRTINKNLLPAVINSPGDEYGQQDIASIINSNDNLNVLNSNELHRDSGATTSGGNTCDPMTVHSRVQQRAQRMRASAAQSTESRNSQDSWANSNSTASLDSPSVGGSSTHHRYYHVFREGELDALINHHVASLHIVSSYYERASWCVVAEKVQVWTI